MEIGNAKLKLENYNYHSPYVYCGNNPISNVDPDGKLSCLAPLLETKARWRNGSRSRQYRDYYRKVIWRVKASNPEYNNGYLAPNGKWRTHAMEVEDVIKKYPKKKAINSGGWISAFWAVKANDETHEAEKQNEQINTTHENTGTDVENENYNKTDSNDGTNEVTTSENDGNSNVTNTETEQNSNASISPNSTAESTEESNTNVSNINITHDPSRVGLIPIDENGVICDNNGTPKITYKDENPTNMEQKQSLLPDKNIDSKKILMNEAYIETADGKKITVFINASKDKGFDQNCIGYMLGYELWINPKETKAFFKHTPFDNIGNPKKEQIDKFSLMKDDKIVIYGSTGKGGKGRSHGVIVIKTKPEVKVIGMDGSNIEPSIYKLENSWFEIDRYYIYRRK